VGYQQPPGRATGTAAGPPLVAYQHQDHRTPHQRYSAPPGRQAQPPPGRQESQLRHPRQQPYRQQPRDPYDQPDPGQWQEQPFWPDWAYRGQRSYPPQRPYGPPSQPSFTPDPQYGTPLGQPTYPGRAPYPPQPYGGGPYPPGQQPYSQQPYLPPGHDRHPYQRAPRKRRRVFLWVFLGIQALFIIWIIVGVATVHADPTQAQLAQGCYNHNWYPLFKSQADCVEHYGGALNDAGTAGMAIGAGLIVAFWMVVDVILGISYGIYKLARRSA